MRARERKLARRVLERKLVVAVVGDVLADPLVAAAPEADDRRPADEVARHVELTTVELVRVDLERQVADEVVERHVRSLPVARGCYSSRAAGDGRSDAVLLDHPVEIVLPRDHVLRVIVPEMVGMRRRTRSSPHGLRRTRRG